MTRGMGSGAWKKDDGLRGGVFRRSFSHILRFTAFVFAGYGLLVLALQGFTYVRDGFWVGIPASYLFTVHDPPDLPDKYDLVIEFRKQQRYWRDEWKDSGSDSVRSTVEAALNGMSVLVPSDISEFERTHSAERIAYALSKRRILVWIPTGVLSSIPWIGRPETWQETYETVRPALRTIGLSTLLLGGGILLWLLSFVTARR